MPSGLNIQDGVYMEEPVRTGLARPVVPEGGRVFEGRNVRRKQTRQAPDYANFRCKWCGSTQAIQLNRETVSQCCPNCGGPR